MHERINRKSSHKYQWKWIISYSCTGKYIQLMPFEPQAQTKIEPSFLIYIKMLNLMRPAPAECIRRQTPPNIIILIYIAYRFVSMLYEYRYVFEVLWEGVYLKHRFKRNTIYNNNNNSMLCGMNCICILLSCIYFLNKYTINCIYGCAYMRIKQ